jgi:hypothetical protein
MTTIYQDRGFANRQDYINTVAVEYELDVDSVRAVADLLGPDEDFDGLLSMCADEAGTNVREVIPL